MMNFYEKTLNINQRPSDFYKHFSASFYENGFIFGPAMPGIKNIAKKKQSTCLLVGNWTISSDIYY